MAANLRHDQWRKSSYSNGENGACVEVALAPDSVAMRDSKNSAGPVLIFGRAGLSSFLGGIKSGRFDH